MFFVCSWLNQTEKVLIPETGYPRLPCAGFWLAVQAWEQTGERGRGQPRYFSLSLLSLVSPQAPATFPLQCTFSQAGPPGLTFSSSRNAASFLCPLAQRVGFLADLAKVSVATPAPVGLLSSVILVGQSLTTLTVFSLSWLVSNDHSWKWNTTWQNCPSLPLPILSPWPFLLGLIWIFFLEEV